MQSDGPYSTLRPVVHGDIALSINNTSSQLGLYVSFSNKGYIRICP